MVDSSHCPTTDIFTAAFEECTLAPLLSHLFERGTRKSAFKCVLFHLLPTLNFHVSLRPIGCKSAEISQAAELFNEVQQFADY
jgi:hypothetical protein